MNLISAFVLYIGMMPCNHLPDPKFHAGERYGNSNEPNPRHQSGSKTAPLLLFLCNYNEPEEDELDAPMLLFIATTMSLRRMN
jgi:hypothetical protein